MNSLFHTHTHTFTLPFYLLFSFSTTYNSHFPSILIFLFPFSLDPSMRWGVRESFFSIRNWFINDIRYFPPRKSEILSSVEEKWYYQVKEMRLQCYINCVNWYLFLGRLHWLVLRCCFFLKAIRYFSMILTHSF